MAAGRRDVDARGVTSTQLTPPHPEPGGPGIASEGDPETGGPQRLPREPGLVALQLPEIHQLGSELAPKGPRIGQQEQSLTP